MKIGHRTGAMSRLGRVAALPLLVGAVGAAIGLPQPAAAAASTCSFARTVCLWSQPSYEGERFTVQATDATAGTCVNLAAHGWGSGRSKSARNTGNQVARLYSTQDCTGTAYQIVPGGTYSSIDFGSNSIFVY